MSRILYGLLGYCGYLCRSVWVCLLYESYGQTKVSESHVRCVRGMGGGGGESKGGSS